MNTPLIAFYSLPKEKTTCLNVVNFGEYKGNKIEYLTKDGLQLKTIPEIENTNVKVIRFEDIDLKSSLFYWYKQNQDAYKLPIEIDYNIEIGEQYQGNLWHIKLFIQKTDSAIKVKPVFS